MKIMEIIYKNQTMKNILIFLCIVFAWFWVWLGYTVLGISQSIAMMENDIDRIERTMDKWTLSE